ncbi:hypothetical protein P3W85_32950 [Cupriavidus basilensis]|uniref:Uncharacterized protein n=1 Tax=Cupriavidus basilensis TaxID=68895 RepID=A0ABT6AYY9_9BURK|nr:hypothetical protein [Cupriavidus basilensis]MDF3837714.1 hypothetical protein [Cupriavidus basilensis]
MVMRGAEVRQNSPTIRPSLVAAGVDEAAIRKRGRFDYKQNIRDRHMELPTQIAEVSLRQDWRHGSPYPPLGFQPFAEGELGNGDTFGLYWPIGEEGYEPLVVET